MVRAGKQCRTCGNPYEACRSAKRADGAFVWQEVACSPECGVVYLKRITDSRTAAVHASKPTSETVGKGRRRKGKGKPKQTMPEPQEVPENFEESSRIAATTSEAEGDLD